MSSEGCEADKIQHFRRSFCGGCSLPRLRASLPVESPPIKLAARGPCRTLDFGKLDPWIARRQMAGRRMTTVDRSRVVRCVCWWKSSEQRNDDWGMGRLCPTVDLVQLQHTDRTDRMTPVADGEWGLTGDCPKAVGRPVCLSGLSGRGLLFHLAPQPPARQPASPPGGAREVPSTAGP